MTKETGELTWWVDEDGKVTFCVFGRKDLLTLEEFRKWLQRFDPN